MSKFEIFLSISDLEHIAKVIDTEVQNIANNFRGGAR